MQRHTILMNPRFTANTISNIATMPGSGQNFMVNEDNYYLNNIAGLNLGVVNPTNVRAYLNNPSNQTIINDFFAYLTGNTTHSEFLEIFYSDQKLSNVFNSYYSQSVFSGQPSSTYYLQAELTGATHITTKYSNFNWDGYSLTKNPFTGLTEEIVGASRFVVESDAIYTYTEDESYYVPVFIKLNYIGTDRQTFDLCDEVINTLINSYIIT